MKSAPRRFAALCVALVSMLVLSACTLPFMPPPTAKPTTKPNSNATTDQ